MRLIFFIPLAALSVSAVSAFDKIIAFADSFTDNGNDYNHSQFPVSPPYYEGRFSNGPTWLEHIAKNSPTSQLVIMDMVVPLPTMKTPIPPLIIGLSLASNNKSTP
jgi:hypothetical protein